MQIAIAGGDRREETFCQLMVEKDYRVKLLSETPLAGGNVDCTESVVELLDGSDIVYAPLSGADDNGYLKSVLISDMVRLDEHFFKIMEPGALFMMGSVKSPVKELLRRLHINYVELTDLDELAILNAIPTAEGALKIAIEETPYTLFQSNVLIFGLGRVGLTLAWRLKLLGASVYVVTRNRAAQARGQDLGLNMLEYSELPGCLSWMDIIYNTVPAPIITEDYICQLSRESLIIDLASAPGGTDFEAAAKYKIRALMVPGLPGRVAPETAGRTLAQVIPGLIERWIKGEKTVETN